MGNNIHILNIHQFGVYENGIFYNLSCRNYIRRIGSFYKIKDQNSLSNCPLALIETKLMAQRQCMYLASLLFLFSIKLMAGVADPAFAWHKKSVSVCWQDAVPLKEELFTNSQWPKLSSTSTYLVNLSTDWKKKIQNAIDSEFTLNKTGVNFVGWKSCENLPKADAVIIIAKSTEHPLGRASVGRSEHLLEEGRRGVIPDGKKAFVFLNIIEVSGSKLTYEQEVIYSAIHEFGHLAGLNHENTNPSAGSDPNCTEDDLYPEFGQETFQYLTDYDPSSIMNYCFYNFIRESSLVFKAEIDGVISNEFSTNIFPYSNFAVYSDPLIFRITPKDENVLNVQARLGLSSMDLKALQLLYRK